MLNCSYGGISCILCNLVTSIAKWWFVCTCSPWQILEFYWGMQYSKAGVSSPWWRQHRGFLCQKILRVYKCRSSHRWFFLDTKYHWLIYWSCLSAVPDALSYLEGFVWFSGNWIKQSFLMLFLGVSCLQSSPKIFMGLGFWCLCHELLNTCHIPASVRILKNPHFSVVTITVLLECPFYVLYTSKAVEVLLPFFGNICLVTEQAFLLLTCSVWNRLPWQVVGLPSLEMFKKCVGVVFRD